MENSFHPPLLKEQIMGKENTDLRMGDAPALMFIPEGLSPDTVIPSNQILMVSSLPLYLFVRDLIVADQSARRLQEQRNDHAIAKMMEALLRYKPSAGKNADALGQTTPPSASTFSHPAIFDIGRWMEGDGEPIKDEDDSAEDVEA